MKITRIAQIASSVLILLLSLCASCALAAEKAQCDARQSDIAGELKKHLGYIDFSMSLPEVKHLVHGPHGLWLYRWDCLGLIEASSVGPDGPVSIAEPIGKADAVALIDLLAARGLLNNARRYYSPCRDNPAGAPPKGATDYRKGHIDTQLGLRVISGDWYVYYAISIPQESSPELFRSCSSSVHGVPSRLLAELGDHSELPDSDQATYEASQWLRSIYRKLQSL